jgi:RHS repeat-associated protein
VSLGPNSLIQQYCQNNLLQTVGARLGPAGGGVTTNCANSSDILNLALTWGSAGANNGNLTQQIIVNNDPLNVTQTYGYDAYNRLSSVSEGSSWSQTYNYDAFGNRTISGNGGTNPLTLSQFAPTASNAYNGQNQLVHMNTAGTASYDLSGNQLIAGGYGFTWDAENRLTQSSINSQPTTYTYDGEGRRVMKATGSVSTTYVYDAGGQLAAEYTTETVPATGTEYLTDDHLGSTRLVTGPTGNVVRRYDFLPFGEDLTAGIDGRSATTYNSPLPVGPTQDWVNDKFTGKLRDNESGLDFFGARYFSGAQGRFTSTDPKTFSKRTIANPQKWNKYAYVLNNPLALFDPDGMEEITVQLRAYIPQAYVGPYRGDNRGPTASQSVTSRTSITMQVETDPKISANPLLSNSGGQAGVTHNDLTGNSATQTQGLPNAQVSRDANGNVVINIKQDAANPLTPQGMTPGIKSDLTVNVPVSGSSVTASGTVSGSPAFELNVGTPGNATTNIPLQGASSNPIMFGIGLTQTNKLPQTTTPLPPPRCTSGQSGCSQ